MAKRVFLIVLDSFGIGGAPDAARFGDEGSNTLAAVLSYSNDAFPNLSKMGLLAIDGEDDPRITAYKTAQASIPSPVLADTGKILMFGLSVSARFLHFSKSNVK